MTALLEAGACCSESASITQHYLQPSCWKDLSGS